MDDGFYLWRLVVQQTCVSTPKPSRIPIGEAARWHEGWRVWWKERSSTTLAWYIARSIGSGSCQSHLALYGCLYTKSMWVLCSPSLMIWITHGSLLISESHDRHFLMFCAKPVNNLRRMAMIRLRVSGTVCLSTLSSALLALCEFTDTQPMRSILCWFSGAWLGFCVAAIVWCMPATFSLAFALWHLAT